MAQVSKAATRRCSIKKVFLKISQNSQGNTSARVSFFKKLKVSTWNFIKTDSEIDVLV